MMPKQLSSERPLMQYEQFIILEKVLQHGFGFISLSKIHSLPHSKSCRTHLAFPYREVSQFSRIIDSRLMNMQAGKLRRTLQYYNATPAGEPPEQQRMQPKPAASS